MMDIIFIETKEGIKNFFFLTELNSTFELNPLHKILIKKFRPKIVVRKELLFKLKSITPYVSDKLSIKKETFIFDSLFIPFELPSLKKEKILVNKGKIVGLFLKKGEIKAPFGFEKFKKFETQEIKGIFIGNFYEIPYLIGELVEAVLRFDRNFKKSGRNLYIKKGKLPKGVYINTEDGPVVIEELKKILPPVTLKGPLYIGNDVHLFRTFIKESFLMDVLRLGGEIDTSLFYGYSNKAHEGYVGHSVVGKWVNLGALTTTSDLKNTYSEIRIYISKNKRINTGKIKLGAFISDHVQTGIGTLLSSGTVIMPFCNLYGGLLFKNFIEPFTWWGPEGKEEYNPSKAIEVAEKMMKRRNMEMEEEYKRLIKKFYKDVAV